LRLGGETVLNWQGSAGPPVKESGLDEEDLEMLAKRLDTIRQGADKRITTDKRVRRMICARRAS